MAKRNSIFGTTSITPATDTPAAVPRRRYAIDNYVSAIRALDPTTGDLQWEFPIKARTRAGVLATAGDLVFSGSVDGYFYALDAVTGDELWHIALGGRMNASPMTYAVNGRQYVTMPAGNVVYTFALND